MDPRTSPLRDPERLAALRRTALLDSPPDPSFDRLTELTRRALEVPVALVSLLDEDRQFLLSGPGLPEPWGSRRQTPLSHSFCRHTVERRGPLEIADAREHPLVRENPGIEEIGVIAYLGVPLSTEEGHVLGTLCAIDHRPREWNDRDLEILGALGESAMTEIRLREMRGRGTELERRLERAEQRANEVEQLASFGTWEWDIRGDVIAWSRELYELWGYEPFSFVPNYARYIELLPPDDRERVDAEVQAALAEKRDFHVEHDVLPPGGEPRRILGNGRVICDDQGQPIRMTGTAQDVTELRAGERRAQALAQELARHEEVEASWERLRTVLDRVSDAFVALDPEMRCVYANRHAGELFERDPESLVGRLLWKPLPDGSTDEIRDTIEEAMRTQRPLEREFYYEPWDRWFEGRAFPAADGVSIFFSEITEARRAEIALRDSEERFRLLVDTLHQAFWLTDPEHRTVLYASPAFERVWGISREALYENPALWRESIHPADRERVRAAEEAQLAGGFDLRYRIVRPGGAVRWIHDRALPVRDERGRTIRLAGIADDVTDQIAAEAELRALFTAMQDVILVLDANGRYLRVAPTGADRLFLPAAELEGRTFHDLLPREQADEFVAAIRASLAGSEPTHLEYSLPIRGRELWFSTTISPLSESTVLWVARDVTEERLAREELRRQAVVFDTISDGIVITDPQGRITDWNPAAERIFERSREEVIGKRPEEVIAGEESDDLSEEIRTSIRSRGIWHGEQRARTRGGRSAVCEVTVLPIRGADETPIGMIAVNRDVTEKRELEEQLWHAQKLEVTGRLAGGVAHDFNNLLTAIIGFATLLESELPAGDANRGSLREIQDAAARAAALTRHLLAFARKQVSRPQTLDLNAHLAGTLPLLRRMVGPQIDLETLPSPELAPVLVDPTHVDQVMTNLVVNARDAMLEGGRLTIRTSNVTLGEADARLYAFLRPGDYVLLEVADTGVGMAPEVRDRAFEPFFTTKEQGKGTGLGLSTVYGIVKQNDGYVLVESTPGVGSVFRIYLPAVESEGDGPAVALPHTEPGHSKGTILLAEDESGVRNLVKRVLSRAGYQIVEAVDGVEAIERFEADPDRIDLVLTDLLMPRASGRLLLERVRAIRPVTPVVVMSGYTAPVGGNELPADVPFIQKPFEPRQLLEAVHSALLSRR